VKHTHAATHTIIGDAITELRRFTGWTQQKLAREISRRTPRGTPAPAAETISRWEHGKRSPDLRYRIALARIAAKDKGTVDLVPVFLAGMESWRVVPPVRILHKRRQKAAQACATGAGGVT
jgi:transcriptional regulator with XRE-family HTH domain